MNVLGIETSCDETSVAIVENHSKVLVNLVSSQIIEHQPYGGVVPEIASRAHLERTESLVREALKSAQISPDQIDAIAVTRGPGLASSLLIGLSFAKGLALSWDKPLLGVNHLQGHLLSPLLSHGLTPENIFPNVSLVVSGGNTLLMHATSPTDFVRLGGTIDDAAGEAFDKVAKMLGIGYPGGPLIDQTAKGANPAAFDFPRPLLKKSNFDFSFSGLKTSVRYFLEKQSPDFIEKNLPDLCASVQEAIVDVLIQKTFRAADSLGVKMITLSGGVSCNSRLRTSFAEQCLPREMTLHLCPPEFTTDNAAMIALVGSYMMTGNPLVHGNGLSIDIAPNLGL